MEEHPEPMLKDILDVVSEIRSLLRVTTFLDVQKLLETTLETDEERLAYDLSDGERTQAEIAQAVRVTQPSISNWWKRWNQMGITIDSRRFAKRQQKAFDLAAYGIHFD